MFGFCAQATIIYTQLIHCHCLFGLIHKVSRNFLRMTKGSWFSFSSRFYQLTAKSQWVLGTLGQSFLCQPPNRFWTRFGIWELVVEMPLEQGWFHLYQGGNSILTGVPMTLGGVWRTVLWSTHTKCPFKIKLTVTQVCVGLCT